MVYAAVLGVSLGVAVAWLAGSLWGPLGTVLVVGLCAAIIWWAWRQFRWARQMGRELREMRDQEDPPA
jgi:hypothetical protein